ncbi:EF-hand domain-containing family member C2 [Trichonephila clavata]|uniref:EF-hand domain-containing family member C2 n=1 Tax=Trichonephila clavata TaxID=2740835 RepID=A0A8X6LGR6_TRICU|nr:EF-hand domain-containing family member C2 [Trichonephila clavata]
MKFIARILSDDPVEKLRRFIICFFLEDDTMSIKSLDEDFRNKNSMEHGNLTRMKAVKPHSTYWNSGRNFYHFTDMFVGNVIYIRGKGYELLEADEYTIDYMERHSEMFPHSNVRKIMTEFKEWIPDKVGSLKFGFEKYDPEKTGYIKEVIYEEMPSDIKTEFPEHAMKTVGRYYAEEKYIGLCLTDLVSRIQSELYRKKFHDFDNVKLAFQIYDSEK